MAAWLCSVAHCAWANGMSVVQLHSPAPGSHGASILLQCAC